MDRKNEKRDPLRGMDVDATCIKVADEGNGNTDLPTDCECDNTHTQNNTVCRFCYEKGDRGGAEGGK